MNGIYAGHQPFVGGADSKPQQQGDEFNSPPSSSSNSSSNGGGPQPSSPYFSKSFLRKPSAQELRLHISEEQSERERSQIVDGNQSESMNQVEVESRNESEIGEKKSPPRKPPRAVQRNKSVEERDTLFPGEQQQQKRPPSIRTMSYVSKNRPSASQRYRPSFVQQREERKEEEISEITESEKKLSVEDQLPVITNVPPKITNVPPLYPWRTTQNGGSELGLGIVMGMDFELSMEPRNVSRPKFRSPTPNCEDDETNKGEEKATEDIKDGKVLGQSTSSSEEFDGEEQQQKQLEPAQNNAVDSDVPRRSMLLFSGAYDKLENSKPTATCNQDKFMFSGDFDKLLPAHNPQTEFSSTENCSTHAVDDRDATTPLGSSSSPADTPIVNCSPTITRRRKGHSRQRSEDLSELSIAKERQYSINPLELSPARALRRQSAYESPQVTKRYLSPGVEESENWQFLPEGYSNGRGLESVSEQRKKRNKWTLFGGDSKPPRNTLFNPKKASRIQRYVSNDDIDINATNFNGDTPLHYYVKLDKPDKLDFLIAFLVHCKINKLDINKMDRYGDTPLHVATKRNDIWSIKLLLAFGADINAQNSQCETPLDLLDSRESPEEIHELFMQLYALPGGRSLTKKPGFLNESLNSIINERHEIEEAEKIGVYLSDERITAFVFKLEQLLRKDDLIFSMHNEVNNDEKGSRFSGVFFDPLIAREKQGQIVQEWKSTLEFKKGTGSRVLFLDGGGIRGLIQIEVLSLVERMTGREITGLFDWIVGTSVGGILALCMVYANMTLSEMRQMYFQFRDEVFSGGIMNAGRRAEALEHILKKKFVDIRMCDRLPSSKCPRVLISAVSTRTNPPRLHFFNNCFDNQYSQELVWKVARYTSAGPTYFSECDNYVDGGVMANNPSMEAWLEICKFYESKGTKPNFAMAVSIGTGIYPPEQLGEVDFFSKGIFDLKNTLNRAKKMIKMLSTALVESERVAEIFSKTCEAIDTSFFRFSPALSQAIRPDETDMKILVDMVIQTHAYLLEQSCKGKFDKMIRLFKHITEVSRGLNLNKQQQQHFDSR